MANPTPDKDLFRRLLKALGGIREGGTEIEELSSQFKELVSLRHELKKRANQVSQKLQVAMAQSTKAQRLRPGDPQYGVHMRHCYGLNYDDHYGPGEPTERYACKYGENDICPAALFEDPWAEYVRAEEAGEL